MVKAWVVEDQLGKYPPVFARTRRQALDLILNNDEDRFVCLPGYREPVVKRAKQYDRYAEEGKVPLEVLLMDGWEWPCRRCGQGVTQRDLQVGARVEKDEVYCAFCAGDLFEEELLKQAGGVDIC